MSDETAQLDQIIASGATGRSRNNIVKCADGFSMSVIAGEFAYCSPRPNGYRDGDPDASFSGPYDEVEVGFPTARPEPWDKWGEYVEDPEDPTGTIYAYVPVGVVRDLVAAHGGEVDRA